MRNQLNLASKPFTNRVLPWTITVIVALFSMASLILIARATGEANAAAYALQADIKQLNEREQALRKQAEEVQASLTADQIRTLAAAHELVDRKRFSWSRLFADLESALPGSVRVTRISVRDVAAQGEYMLAELDMTVVAKAPETITAMIGDMDRAGTFQTELRSQNLQKGRGETGTEFELYVVYRPRASSPLVERQASSIASVDPAASEEQR